MHDALEVFMRADEQKPKRRNLDYSIHIWRPIVRKPKSKRIYDRDVFSLAHRRRYEH